LLLQRLALQLWLWSVLLLLLPSLVHSCHITISNRLLASGFEQWRPWQLGSLIVDVLLLGGCVQRRHLESSFFETIFLEGFPAPKYFFFSFHNRTF
jgi:hypothetical protein